jgi:hypothetical protein
MLLRKGSIRAISAAASTGQTPARRSGGSPNHRTYPRCIGKLIAVSADKRKAPQPETAIFYILNLTFEI